MWPQELFTVYFSHCDMHLCSWKENPILYSQVLDWALSKSLWCQEQPALCVPHHLCRQQCDTGSGMSRRSSSFSAQLVAVEALHCLWVTWGAEHCCALCCCCAPLGTCICASLGQGPALGCWGTDPIAAANVDSECAFVRGIEPQFASSMPGRTQSAAFVLDNECWIF